MYQIGIIPFKETNGFISIKNLEDQKIYVSPKTLCEIFGISWQSQQEKLAKNAQRWHYQMISVVLPGDTRHREIGVIPDSKVRSWICGINVEKVKPEMQEQLLAFQDECDQVLNDYWNKGIAINPRHSEQIQGENFPFSLAQTISNSIKEAMHELAIALKASFVSQDRFQDFAKSCENRFTALEKDKKAKILDVPAVARISVEQAQLLCNLVKEKATTRKEICQIWKNFKQNFQVKSYQHLPSSLFQEALRWVNQL